MKLQKNYKATLTEELLNTTSGEIEVKLSIAPVSDMGFIVLEPGLDNEENCFYHRKSGNSIFIYGVNRDNPTAHGVNSNVVLASSIETFNYILSIISEVGFIYKKDLTDVIIKGGKAYDGGASYNIADVDTSDHIAGKQLTINSVNYIYIESGEIYIDTTYNETRYNIAEIDVGADGNISNILKYNILLY